MLKATSVRYLCLAAMIGPGSCKTSGPDSTSTEQSAPDNFKTLALGQERPEPDEQKPIDQLNDLTVAIMKKTHQLAGKPSAPLLRDVHSKSNGCAQGIFEIAPNLDPKLQTGVFQAGARYPVIIRTSNGAAGITKDGDLSSRGFAMKLLGVDAILDKYQVPAPERAWLLPQFSKLGQDFTFLNAKSFIIKDLPSYVTFTQGVNDRGISALAAFISANVNDPVFKPMQLATFLGEVTQKVGNPLGISYFGQTPYKFKNTAYKFRIDHCANKGPVADQRPNGSDPNFLYAAMAETLKSSSVCYAFSIILQQNPDIQPIEDSHVVWPSDDDDIATHKPTANRTEIARITIPRQDITTPAMTARCEALSYNPWNGLAAHKPLGNMNRARKTIYMTGAANRPANRQGEQVDAIGQAMLDKYSAY